MKAHVENGSKRGEQDIPPFCFPAPHVSGPDIVFYIKINKSVYPVFVQLKLRQALEGTDNEKALATVSSHTVQEKMKKEHEKIEEEQEKMQKEQKNQQKKCKGSTSSDKCDQSQTPRLHDYCLTGVYISMIITYPAEVVKFQIVRPDPEPELDGLKHVSINIDDNNFPQIFPKRHVQFLDRLKQHKRPAADESTSKLTKNSRLALARSATDPLPRDD